MPDSSPNPIRVLIVDDSFFMRKLLAEILGGQAETIFVAGTAQNGTEAVEKCKSLSPDVITLDVEMPEMDGLTALEKIMREKPTPVLMLSSHTGKGTEATIRALQLGAVDCILKPSGMPISTIKSVQDELIEKIKLASRCRVRSISSETVETQPAPARSFEPESPTVIPAVSRARIPSKPARAIVAVAASTGGPRALQQLLSAFTAKLPAAVVIVQHISIGFTRALAQRLAECCPLKVSEAEDGERILEGHVYIAPAGRHLAIEGKPGYFKAVLSDEPPRLGVRPSGDIMLKSVAKAGGKEAIGIVLTGMGKDGTQGLREIHQAGGKTFAQDEESCVVYGMPKAAVEAGVVDLQMPADQIADRVESIFREK